MRLSDINNKTISLTLTDIELAKPEDNTPEKLAERAMSDNKNGFEIGDLSIDVSDDGKLVYFSSVGDPYDAPILHIDDLNEFYEKLGEMVKYINSNK